MFPSPADSGKTSLTVSLTDLKAGREGGLVTAGPSSQFCTGKHWLDGPGLFQQPSARPPPPPPSQQQARTASKTTTIIIIINQKHSTFTALLSISTRRMRGRTTLSSQSSPHSPHTRAGDYLCQARAGLAVPLPSPSLVSVFQFCKYCIVCLACWSRLV